MICSIVMEHNKTHSYEMISSLIAPYLGDDKRITIALNRCDFAMSGRLTPS